VQAPAWEFDEGPGPIIAVAVHNGHDLRPEVVAFTALDDAQRLREEDPYTGGWTAVGDTAVVVRRSRFEVDLNRSRALAVYLEPEQAWGLRVWRERPPDQVVARSLAQYDAFYEQMTGVLSRAGRAFGRFVVLDLHTYNHRRDGPDAVADPAANPEINVGTGTMPRELWAPLVERFMADLRRQDVLGRRPDVRENVRFRGGYFARWVHETFPQTGCALAIEVKKTFMDEHTGELDYARWAAIGQALKAAVPGLREELVGGERNGAARRTGAVTAGSRPVVRRATARGASAHRPAAAVPRHRSAQRG
jgi:N-formylglutamate amidohydrolase